MFPPPKPAKLMPSDSSGSRCMFVLFNCLLSNSEFLERAARVNKQQFGEPGFRPGLA